MKIFGKAKGLELAESDIFCEKRGADDDAVMEN